MSKLKQHLISSCLTYKNNFHFQDNTFSFISFTDMHWIKSSFPCPVGRFDMGMIVNRVPYGFLAHLSLKAHKWAFDIWRLRCPSVVVVHTL